MRNSHTAFFIPFSIPVQTKKTLILHWPQRMCNYFGVMFDFQTCSNNPLTESKLLWKSQLWYVSPKIFFKNTILVKFLIYLITNIEYCRNIKHSSAFYVTLHPQGVPWIRKPAPLAKVASH
jgi:hypothetical protein